MVSHEQIETLLQTDTQVAHIKVTGDGYHYQLTVVSDVFEGQSKVARQRWVYQKLNHYIASGELHAIQMNTWTNAEWEKHHG